MEIFVLGAVPWIFGVIYIVKLISRSSGKISDFELIKALQVRMGLSADKETKRKIGEVINIYSPDKVSLPTTSPVVIKSAPSVANQAHEDQLPQISTPVPSVPLPPSVAHKPMANPLENINILLYLGAFLVVVAAGIFVGYNYQLLSGASKVIFILLFSLIFYFSGLALYCYTSKLKPAGLTFNTIGMIIIPLVGIAYWRFVANGDYSNQIWFATSAISLFFYVASVYVLRKTFVAYFLTFTALSFFESSISLFSFPVYYLFWGMAIFSLITNYISRKINDSNGIKQSLEYTSQFILPIALLCSFLSIMSYSYTQAGINSLIGFVFYLLSSFMEEKKETKYLTFTFSIALAYIGSALSLYGVTRDIHSIGWIIIALSATCVFLSIIAFNILKKSNYADILTYFTAVMSLVAGAFVYGVPKTLLIIVAISLILNIVITLVQKKTTSLVFSIISLMEIPAVYFGLISNNSYDNYMLVISYMIIGILLYALKVFLTSQSKIFKDIFLCGFVFSIGLALVIAVGGDVISVIFYSFLFTALLFFALSFYENKNIYFGLSIGLMLIVLFIFRAFIKMDESYLPLLLTAFGFLYYLVDSLFKDKRTVILQYSAVIYMAISTIYAFAVSQLDIVPIIVFYAFGTTLFYLGHAKTDKIIRYIAAGLLVGATETLMGYLHVKELHYYMLLWSFYFAVLAYLEFRAHKKDITDVLVCIALAFQTLPLFSQTQGANGHVYGLILGIESIIIVLVGMALKYKILKYWGSVSLIIIVLFQLKDELLALPKWLIIGVIGLAFLFGAMYMLYKRQDHESSPE